MTPVNSEPLYYIVGSGVHEPGGLIDVANRARGALFEARLMKAQANAMVATAEAMMREAEWMRSRAREIRLESDIQRAPLTGPQRRSMLQPVAGPYASTM